MMNAELRIPSEVDRAIEVFANGFAMTRCFTHPAHAKRVGNLWVIRDAERTRAADYRREEWVAIDSVPKQVDAAARRGTRGRFCICAVCSEGTPDVAMREAYRSLGYRLGATEPLMAHRLKRIPKLPEPLPIERVLTQELSDRVTKASGRRQILPADLADGSAFRMYSALDGDEPVGWLKSITIGDATWVSNVHVLPEYRRRGIGKSLIAKMLRDDRAYGAVQSTLLASHTGALLYETMGYERLGTLYIYTPTKPRSPAE